MPQLRSLRAATTEAHIPRSCALQQEKPLQWEAWALQLESSPYSPQVEKAHMQQLRPSTAKNKLKKKKQNRMEMLEIKDMIQGIKTLLDGLKS